MPAWSTLAAELGVNERTLRRGHTTGWISAQRSSYRAWFVGADERDYLIRHWTLLTALRECLRNEPRARLAVLVGPAAQRDYDGVAVPTILASLVRRTGSEMVVAARLTRVVGRPVAVVPLDDNALRASGALILDARRFSRVLRDPDDEWRRWKEQARILGRDGRPRATELQLPDEYLLDEEHFTPEALVAASRRVAGEPDPLGAIDPF
jgi:hypothetical protein